MSEPDTSDTRTVKAMTCHVQIVGVRAKADGSLGVTLSTPELRADEKAVFMDWMNRDLTMLLQADMAGVGDIKEVKGEFDHKTPSQRLRAALYVWWQQLGQEGEFDGFYLRHMEKLIEHVKGKLEPR